jgi:hypothetical protein
MIEWLKAAAPLVTLGGFATLIGVMIHFFKEWKAALEAKHQSELAEKDRMIKELRADAYPAAAESSTIMKTLIESRDANLKLLNEELDKTQLQDREKANLLQHMKLRFGSEQRVLKAALDIGSKDPSTRLKAARELLEIRDPRTIPRLVQTMSEENYRTPTKATAMKALIAFGEDAVPSLINQVREHARWSAKTPAFQTILNWSIGGEPSSIATQGGYSSELVRPPYHHFVSSREIRDCSVRLQSHCCQQSSARSSAEHLRVGEEQCSEKAHCPAPQSLDASTCSPGSDVPHVLRRDLLNGPVVPQCFQGNPRLELPRKPPSHR